MDFDLSSEQQMLRDSVERFVQEEYDFARRREIAASDEGFSRDHWRRFAELGWLAVPIPEAWGGLGGGPVEVMILMEAFGRALALEPYVPSVVLGAGLVREGGSEPRKAELLPRVGAGELILAFAHSEPGSRYDLADVSTRAERLPGGGGWRLRGRKSVVLHGGNADRLLVSARTAGGTREEAGISVFLVDPKGQGISIQEARSFDRTPVADVLLEGAVVPQDALLGEADAAFPHIERVVDEATAAVCADALGAMQAVHAITNEYLKTRQQFGQPLARFQVLQHRLVDMFIALEQSRSLMYLATLKLGAPRAERRQAVASAKAQCSEAGRFVGGQAVQLHGGMGMTDELIVSHYYKRLMLDDILFGNADHHLKRFAALTQRVA